MFGLPAVDDPTHDLWRPLCFLPRFGPYAVSIVPGELRLRLTRYADAIEKGLDIAQRAPVNVWFTCNHTNYLQVGVFREEESEASAMTAPFRTST
jgi:hypothetical protein